MPWQVPSHLCSSQHLLMNLVLRWHTSCRQYSVLIPCHLSVCQLWQRWQQGSHLSYITFLLLHLVPLPVLPSLPVSLTPQLSLHLLSLPSHTSVHLFFMLLRHKATTP